MWPAVFPERIDPFLMIPFQPFIQGDRRHNVEFHALNIFCKRINGYIRGMAIYYFPALKINNFPDRPYYNCPVMRLKPLPGVRTL